MQETCEFREIHGGDTCTQLLLELMRVALLLRDDRDIREARKQRYELQRPRWQVQDSGMVGM